MVVPEDKDIDDQDQEAVLGGKKEEHLAREISSMPSEEMAELLIMRLHFSIQKMELYGSSHPIAQEALHQVYGYFREALERRPAITLSLGEEGSILVDDFPIPRNYFTNRFAQDFDRHRIPVSYTHLRAHET